jgi:uncharacterized membrane protein YkoI
MKLSGMILAAALSGASCIYFGSNAAFSDDHDSDEDSRLQSPTEIRAAVAQGQVLPLPRILELARARVSGDPIKIELESKHGRLEYEVKILTQTGRVREVKLDARTGAILKIDEED